MNCKIITEQLTDIEKDMLVAILQKVVMTGESKPARMTRLKLADKLQMSNVLLFRYEALMKSKDKAEG